MLKQIWTDDDYVYAATTSGLNIIDLDSGLLYARATYLEGLNSVWSDDEIIYLATTDSGIKVIDKTCISGSTVSPYELSICLIDYLNVPDLLSNEVRYIHGNGQHLAICTASGINYWSPDIYHGRLKCYISTAHKVFITSTGKIYYTTWSGVGDVWKINIKQTNGLDWSEPDNYYQTGTFLINTGVTINDIFVTEGTSETGASNTIFVATSSGVFLIDEETDDGETYYVE